MKNRNMFHSDFRLNGRAFTTPAEMVNYTKILSDDTSLFLSNLFNEKDTITVKTSGSTGKPKLISLKKEHMVHSALATATFFELYENTRALLCLSTEFIAGKMMLVRALVLGWHLDIITPGSNPLQTGKHYDFCAMVPFQLENSIDQLHKVDKLIVGGAPVSEVLIQKLRDVRTLVYATYGMTETITHIAVKNLSQLPLQRGYTVLPGIEISRDKRNCLVIDAPNLSDNKIITNDVVEIVSNTEFNWLGRHDNIVNSGGIKLVPEQIEKKISAIISGRFLITGVPDKQLGEKLVLIIERGEPIDTQNLKSEISNIKTLTKYEIPKEVIVVKEFSETPTGKINRQETKKLLLS